MKLLNYSRTALCDVDVLSFKKPFKSCNQMEVNNILIKPPFFFAVYQIQTGCS